LDVEDVIELKLTKKVWGVVVTMMIDGDVPMLTQQLNTHAGDLSQQVPTHFRRHQAKWGR
jgi:hypothetical protein